MSQSFLHEAQKIGKAPEKINIDNLEDAIKNICNILNDEDLENFNKIPAEKWDPIIMSIYCHDCHAIVPAGIGKTFRGKSRPVCGICHSKKISSGRKEALEKFYHVDKDLTVKNSENTK